MSCAAVMNSRSTRVAQDDSQAVRDLLPRCAPDDVHGAGLAEHDHRFVLLDDDAGLAPGLAVARCRDGAREH